MSDATAPPALEYAARPSVGGMTLTRTTAGTTVVVRPTRREFARAAAAGLVPAGFLAAAAIAPFLSFPALRTPAIIAVAAVVVALAGVAAVVPTVMTLKYGVTWEATPTGLTVTGRQWNRISRQFVPAADGVAVEVERVRVAGHPWRERASVLVGPNGGRSVWLAASRPSWRSCRPHWRRGSGTGRTRCGRPPTRPPHRCGAGSSG